jgi:hypothetical protein
MAKEQLKFMSKRERREAELKAIFTQYDTDGR